MWLGQPRPTLRRWLVMGLGVPALAALAISPWLVNISAQLGADVVSPFARSADHLRTMLVFNGLWTIPAGLIGIVTGLRKREQPVLLALGWLVLIVDFAVLGITEALFPWLPLFRYDYPFSIAWHGPIIPLTILSGMGLLWIWENWLEARLGAALHRYAYALLGAGALVALALLVFSPQILEFSKGRVSFFGAFASHADVAAMLWLRANTPEDARVLNFPGTQFDNSHEGDWVPVISERDSVYYRWQPFFRNNEASLAEQEALQAFWRDPANSDHIDLLRTHGIDYVIVPQIVADPGSLDTAWRWNEPFAWAFEMQSSVADAPYLEQVFEADGAQVYAVR